MTVTTQNQTGGLQVLESELASSLFEFTEESLGKCFQLPMA